MLLVMVAPGYIANRNLTEFGVLALWTNDQSHSLGLVHPVNHLGMCN